MLRRPRAAAALLWLCCVALMRLHPHGGVGLLGVEAAVGPYEHMMHPSELCSEEVHGFQSLASGQFAAVSTELQLVQAFINPHIVCAFVMVPRLDLTADVVRGRPAAALSFCPEVPRLTVGGRGLPDTQALGMGLLRDCIRVTSPFCEWQTISRTLVIVPDPRLPYVEVLQPERSVQEFRFTVAPSAKVVMAGFKVRACPRPCSPLPEP
jgi:hypothetical protein